jgi:xylulokinase
MHSMYLLAIDLGTSVCKVALLSARGEILELEMEPVPLTLLPDGGAEQSPHDWWRIITHCTIWRRCPLHCQIAT